MPNTTDLSVDRAGQRIAEATNADGTPLLSPEYMRVECLCGCHGWFGQGDNGPLDPNCDDTKCEGWLPKRDLQGLIDALEGIQWWPWYSPQAGWVVWPEGTLLSKVGFWHNANDSLPIAAERAFEAAGLLTETEVT